MLQIATDTTVDVKTTIKAYILKTSVLLILVI